jgi:hypothetical protein
LVVELLVLALLGEDEEEEGGDQAIEVELA